MRYLSSKVDNIPEDDLRWSDGLQSHMHSLICTSLHLHTLTHTRAHAHTNTYFKKSLRSKQRVRVILSKKITVIVKSIHFLSIDNIYFVCIGGRIPLIASHGIAPVILPAAVPFLLHCTKEDIEIEEGQVPGVTQSMKVTMLDCKPDRFQRETWHQHIPAVQRHRHTSTPLNTYSLQPLLSTPVSLILFSSGTTT